MKNNPKGWLHGECVIKQSKLPADAVPCSDLKRTADGAFVIADSETTGNHHVIDAIPEVKFFSKGSTRYVVSTKPFNVRCVLKERHDTLTLPKGTYQLGYQQEYDYLTQSLRNVRD
jgi:hypothetical protein